MNKPTIGIIGMGFVGNAIFQTINQSFKVLTYDINKYKCNSTLSSLSQKCKIIFICLPTPTDKKGECNTESIKDTISQINKFSKDNILILKSTVSIGTTQKLSEIFKNFTLVHNPEFLTEKNSVSDFKNTTRIILGGSKSATSIVSEFYCKLFPDATIVQTNSNSSELIKYTTNAFLATKVLFANEIYEVCSKLEINYNEIIDSVKLDARIGKSHWSVPGNDGKVGFGGSCLPKDLLSFTNDFYKLSLSPTLLEAVIEKNNVLRKKNNLNERT